MYSDSDDENLGLQSPENHSPMETSDEDGLLDDSGNEAAAPPPPVIPAPVALEEEDLQFAGLFELRETKSVSRRSEEFPVPDTVGKRKVCEETMQLPFTNEEEAKFKETYKSYGVVFKPPMIDEEIINLLNIWGWPPMGDKKEYQQLKAKGKINPCYKKEKELYGKTMERGVSAKPLAALIDDIANLPNLTMEEKKPLVRRLTDSLQVTGNKIRELTELRRINLLEPCFPRHILTR